MRTAILNQYFSIRRISLQVDFNLSVTHDLASCSLHTPV